MNELPLDFDPCKYTQLYPDLAKLNCSQAEQHYIKHGKNEGRIYKLDLPNDFNPVIYKELNIDLVEISDMSAMVHYTKYGKVENRVYQDPYFDAQYFCEQNHYEFDNTGSNIGYLYRQYKSDIRQPKSKVFEDIVQSYKTSFVATNKPLIILINHDASMYGASHFMYVLYGLLKLRFEQFQFKLCEVQYNDVLESKYNISKDDVWEYRNDPTLLYSIYSAFEPSLVYFNSTNNAYSEVMRFIPDTKYILHSHEIMEHYTVFAKRAPHYVVSERIALQYVHNGYDCPYVQREVLQNIDELLSLSEERVDTDTICNSHGVMSQDTITICMCGQVSERKNTRLFIQVAEAFPQYNFLWIGGDKKQLCDTESTPNLYHIPYTVNPFKYYKQVVDYFILFSKYDPCPYVILENILLETNIITFSENIYTDHKHELTEGFYHEVQGSISYDLCKDAIHAFVHGKKLPGVTGNGLTYIRERFSEPSAIYREFEKIYVPQ